MFKFNYKPSTVNVKSVEKITKRAGFRFQVLENGVLKKPKVGIQVGTDLTVHYSPGAYVSIQENCIRIGSMGIVEASSDRESRYLMSNKHKLPQLLTELALKICPKQESLDLISGKTMTTEPVVLYCFFDQESIFVEKRETVPAQIFFTWLGTCSEKVKGSFENLSVEYDPTRRNTEKSAGPAYAISFGKFGLIEVDDRGITDKIEGAFRDLAINLAAADQSGDAQIWNPTLVTRLELE